MSLTLLLRRSFRVRSFKRTLIFLVVILVQVWLAIPVFFSQRGSKWPQEFKVVFPEKFEAPFVPLVIFSSYRPRYLERTLDPFLLLEALYPAHHVCLHYITPKHHLWMILMRRTKY